MATQDAEGLDSGKLLDKLTKTFIRIRTAREELKREFDAKDKALEEQMTAIKQHMLEHCKQHGVESVRTPSGTFIRSVKTRYWTSDWGAMHAFILERGLPGFLEKRLNQTEVREYLQENPADEDRPPALNVDSEYTITVRKA